MPIGLMCGVEYIPAGWRLPGIPEPRRGVAVKPRVTLWEPGVRGLRENRSSASVPRVRRLTRGFITTPLRGSKPSGDSFLAADAEAPNLSAVLVEAAAGGRGPSIPQRGHSLRLCCRQKPCRLHRSARDDCENLPALGSGISCTLTLGRYDSRLRRMYRRCWMHRLQRFGVAGRGSQRPQAIRPRRSSHLYE
jgi:hypothetical protein